MKFIVDSMLGRLTRWLRMSGYDVSYIKDSEDDEILKRAKREKRILLTRDRDLYKRAVKLGVSASLLQDDDFIRRLRQVEGEYGIKFKETPVASRCPTCNGAITQVKKRDIKNKVPQKVYKVNEKFWKCTECGKIYWHGGHWENIKKMVEKLRDV